MHIHLLESAHIGYLAEKKKGIDLILMYFNIVTYDDEIAKK